jgi:hypothetical protein
MANGGVVMVVMVVVERMVSTTKSLPTRQKRGKSIGGAKQKQVHGKA